MRKTATLPFVGQRTGYGSRKITLEKCRLTAARGLFNFSKLKIQSFLEILTDEHLNETRYSSLRE